MKKLPQLSFLTLEKRRVYSLEITLNLNGRILTKLIIDPHFELKHGNYIDDELIYNLVLLLKNKRFVPKDRRGSWEYFDAEIFYQDSFYRLV
jgi:hypothetical protein